MHLNLSVYLKENIRSRGGYILQIKLEIRSLRYHTIQCRKYVPCTVK